MRVSRSKKIRSGRPHTLILGWSEIIYPILKEIASANENVRRPKVFILAKESEEWMKHEIQSQNLGKLKIKVRSGDQTNPQDLEMSSVSSAKSVIVLPGSATEDITSTILAIRSINPEVNIVVEDRNSTTGEAFTISKEARQVTVHSQGVIARVAAQVSRQSGLSSAILDLLDFAGDEIYFANVPALAGKTYADAILAFNEASVIGLIDNSSTQLNPPMGRLLSRDTKIIAIAKDDDTVIYTGVREDIAKTQVVETPRQPDKPQNLLIIGWSAMGNIVLNQLAEFLPAGSTVQILAQEKFVNSTQLSDFKFESLKVSQQTIDGGINDLIALTTNTRYDQIVVLGYRSSINPADADAQTVLTMRLLNQALNQEVSGAKRTRMLAEILDSAKIDLATVAQVDDLVVSNSLAGLVIAQLSENPSLLPVFIDLFDAEGATINVRSITDYSPVGRSVSFAELAATARNFGESAIGYRSASRAVGDSVTGVLLNPAKTMEFIPEAGDSLIVVGNL